CFPARVERLRLPPRIPARRQRHGGHQPGHGDQAEQAAEATGQELVETDAPGREHDPRPGEPALAANSINSHGCAVRAKGKMDTAAMKNTTDMMRLSSRCRNHTGSRVRAV